LNIIHRQIISLTVVLAHEKPGGGGCGGGVPASCGGSSGFAIDGLYRVVCSPPRHGSDRPIDPIFGPERRALIHTLDAAKLEALYAQIRTERRWP
jgi:hypothetical protein